MSDAERVTYYDGPDVAAAALRGWTRTMGKIAKRASVEPQTIAEFEVDMRGIGALLIRFGCLTSSPENMQRDDECDPENTCKFGDPDPTSGGGPLCWAVHPHTGLFCARQENHAGQHVAPVRGTVRAVWQP
ncbi:MAG TPA: hypothetical protein VF506_20140 [Streptosporangiaceae bacterium]